MIASPRQVIGKEGVPSADRSRALIQSLSYEMRTKWTIFQACKYVTNGSAGTIDSNHDDTMLHSQARLCRYRWRESWAVNPCMTGFQLHQPRRRFLAMFPSNPSKFWTTDGLNFIFTVKDCCWVTVDIEQNREAAAFEDPNNYVLIHLLFSFIVM